MLRVCWFSFIGYQWNKEITLVLIYCVVLAGGGEYSTLNLQLRNGKQRDESLRSSPWYFILLPTPPPPSITQTPYKITRELIRSKSALFEIFKHAIRLLSEFQPLQFLIMHVVDFDFIHMILKLIYDIGVNMSFSLV